MVPSAFPPMEADKAALGFIPITAFQYCEAMRTASALGWYVFPVEDIELMWNGADVYHSVDGAWQVLHDHHRPDFQSFWNENCPPGFKGLAPPFIQALPAKGVVQIWSGWLIETAEGFNSLVRPIVNAHRSQLYYCYEGVIETDRFSPCPLFMNIQLVATHVGITLRKSDPLFQVQVVERGRHGGVAVHIDEAFQSTEGGSGMSEGDWRRFRATVRTDGADEQHRLGDYGGAVRKRQKSGSP